MRWLVILLVTGCWREAPPRPPERPPEPEPVGRPYRKPEPRDTTAERLDHFAKELCACPQGDTLCKGQAIFDMQSWYISLEARQHPDVYPDLREDLQPLVDRFNACIP